LKSKQDPETENAGDEEFQRSAAAEIDEFQYFLIEDYDNEADQDDEQEHPPHKDLWTG
jgi:hypothetical protein